MKLFRRGKKPTDAEVKSPETGDTADSKAGDSAIESAIDSASEKAGYEASSDVSSAGPRSLAGESATVVHPGDDAPALAPASVPGEPVFPGVLEAAQEEASTNTGVPIAPATADAVQTSRPFTDGLQPPQGQDTLASGGTPASAGASEEAIVAQGMAAPAATTPGDAPTDSPVEAVPESASGELASGSADSPADSSAEKEEPSLGFYARLKRGLSRTGSQMAAGLGDLFLGRKVVDDDLLEDLESQLLMSDLGIEATQRVIDDMTSRVSRKELTDGAALLRAVKAALLDIIRPCEVALDVSTRTPFVILVVGVNGVGKTTTIGKLANRYKSEGKKVMLAAGDTFRAAAVEQLQTWGARNDVPVVAQHTGADSASVLFDAVEAARSRGVDVLIADTAGRLQNKAHLMDELEKVVRVMRKLEPEAPHETLLVLDAGTGQNAVSQAEQFDKAVGVTGVVLTKLDGTAKGGVIFAIANKLRRPIRFIGVGESADDLRPFEAELFVDALFDQGN